MTLHENLSNNHYIRRRVGSYLRTRQMHRDFKRVAEMFPVGYIVAESNHRWADDYKKLAAEERVKLVAEIRASLGVIDYAQTHRRSRFAGSYYNADALRGRKAMFKTMGRDMHDAIKANDGDDFLHNVYSRAEGLDARLARKLRDVFVDKTDIQFETCCCCSAITTENDTDGWEWINDNYYCGSCVDDNARYSNLMDQWLMNSDCVPFYESLRSWQNESADDYVTTRWARSPRREDSYHIADQADGNGSCVVDEETWYEIRRETEDNDDEPDVYSYHSGHRVGFIPTEYSKRKHKVYLGIELEFEFNENSEMHDAVRWVKDSGLGNTYGVMEHDGSLEKGFEFITGHTGIDQHKNYLGKLLAVDGTLYQNARTSADTTGTHVHVTKQDMTWWHITKLAAWVYNPENRNFMERVAGRHIGGEYRTEVDYLEYAKQVGQRHADAKKNGWGNAGARNEANSQYIDWSRYGALSVETSTSRTVEFRLFRGSIHQHEVLAWAEFAFASWHFSQQHGMTEMNVPQFIKFIYRADNRMDTVHLRKYLEADKNHPLAIQEALKYTPRKKPAPGEPEQLRIKLNGAKTKRVV